MKNDRVEVYVKKEDRKNKFRLAILFLIFLIITIGFGILIFIDTKEIFKIRDNYPFPTNRELNMYKGFGDLFAFIGGTIYVLFLNLKKPKPFKAKLISKENQNFQGMSICYMTFLVEPKANKHLEEGQEKFPDEDFKCYTVGNNDLEINKDYLLYIKDIERLAEYVKEMDDNIKTIN